MKQPIRVAKWPKVSMGGLCNSIGGDEAGVSFRVRPPSTITVTPVDKNAVELNQRMYDCPSKICPAASLAHRNTPLH